MRIATIVLPLLLARHAIAGPVHRMLCDESLHVLTAIADPRCSGPCSHRYRLVEDWTLNTLHQWFPLDVAFGGHGSQVELVIGAPYLVLLRAPGYHRGGPEVCSFDGSAEVVAVVPMELIEALRRSLATIGMDWLAG